jgi:hypothetical protein
MNTESGNKQGGDDVSEIKRRPVDQGGHKGHGGHGGQQSGGMGGMHGGDLHNIGSGQSGMTGRGGMGGNDNDHAHPSATDATQEGGNEQRAEASGYEDAEIQQSTQREGMGHHRHPGRPHEQAQDASDADNLGRHDSSAADAEKNP